MSDCGIVGNVDFNEEGKEEPDRAWSWARANATPAGLLRRDSEKSCRARRNTRLLIWGFGDVWISEIVDIVSDQ